MEQQVINAMETGATAMNAAAGSVAKKGIFTKQNGIYALAAIGAIGLVWHGTKLAKAGIDKFRKSKCEEKR